MTVLVVGATGATGRLLVADLLSRGEPVRAVVRSPDGLTDWVREHPLFTLLRANLLDLDDADLRQQVTGCRAVASCLGHNMTFRGIYGSPRRLVADATRRLCAAIRANTQAQARPVRFVLMNTAGNQNRDLNEPLTRGERLLLGAIRVALPPHADNEMAADFLRLNVGKDDGAIEWVVLRPDTLVDASAVSAYVLHPSPTRSALFHPGKSSRINVAHCMAELITRDERWRQWRGQMPVIYNSA